MDNTHLYLCHHEFALDSRDATTEMKYTEEFIELYSVSPCADPDRVKYGDYVEYYVRSFIPSAESPALDDDAYDRELFGLFWICASETDESPTLSRIASNERGVEPYV